MSVEGSITVLVADDHAIVRDGIQSILSTEQTIVVVAEASNGAEAIARAAEHQPRVVLMDLVMPEVDGVEATRKILADQPDTGVLVLTSFAAEDKILPALKAGALGYLLKDSGAEELIDAIRQVSRGESSLHPLVARKVLRELADEAQAVGAEEQLTRRENEVLKLIAQGLSNQSIAEALVISEATARNHVSNILGKLHLSSRTQAALYALREGLAELEDAPD
ncbi:MAG: response regulator [Nitrospiraceae bacterium]